MSIKPNAHEIIKNRRLKEKEELQSKVDKARTAKEARCKDLLVSLLSGKPLTPEAGREFFWEFVANNSAMSRSPFTGNSETFFRLGEQQWPKDLLEIAKRTSMDLYQLMEREAYERKRMEEQ